ncbi:MAG: DUF2971 domain-containing protein [Bacteroidales bacterium]|nr:DUF2971 domain-containing protein [Candidatus Cryptobacteroides aphodequi]
MIYLDNEAFSIEYDKVAHPFPSSFYKYYSLSPNSIDAITSSYIYASHPYQLNDSFDCDKNIIHFEDEKALFGNQYNEMCNTFSPQEIKKMSQDLFYSEEYRKCGIISLATSCVNELMWAHYSGKKGICVEFDIGKFDFRYYGPFPINYVECLPKVCIPDRSASVAMSIQCTVKHSVWSYENEWRILVPNPNGQDFESFGHQIDGVNPESCHNRRFTYSVLAVKRIVLGIEFINVDEIISSEENVYIFKPCCGQKAKLIDHIVINTIPTFQLIKADDQRGYDIIPVTIFKIENGLYRVSVD